MKIAAISLLSSLAPIIGAKMNVLFIANDDLRPMIPGMKPEDSPYDFMVTPNLDKFIEESTTFTNAHVQFAECGPSRASILFGRRPDTT